MSETITAGSRDTGRWTLIADDKPSPSIDPTKVVFMMPGGVEITESYPPGYGIAWCIRHARYAKPACLWWEVLRGDGVVIAESITDMERHHPELLALVHRD